MSDLSKSQSYKEHVAKRPKLTVARKELAKPPTNIDKHATMVKVAEDGETGHSAVMAPNDAQLEQINRFTRSPKTAEDVVVMPTLSCNDLPDRDDDRFITECVKEFAALPEPLSPLGKSYMVSHDYTKLPVGRIFGTGTEEIDGATFLTNEVYVPNTEQHRSFIENVDFGIYWAVSVGVVLGANQCSVCLEPMMSFWGWTWCKEGHDKGLYYNPKKDERDDDGYPIPVDPSSKDAVKCIQEFKDPRDFYELSQVFLGAQYWAALEEKDPAMASIVKSAKSTLPIVGVSREEAKKLPIPHPDERLKEAQRKYVVQTEDDGTLTWTDENRLQWEFDAESNEVLCLGKKEATDNGRSSSDRRSERPGSEERSAVSAADPIEGAGSSEGTPSGGSGNSRSSHGSGQASVAGADVGRDAILSAATKAALPAPILEKLVGAGEGEELDVFMAATAEHIKGLADKASDNSQWAVLGKSYLEALKADTIGWYVKAHQGADNTTGVKTDTVTQLLEACGENVELIKALQTQYQDLAKARFPSTVLRSTIPDDPNERNNVALPPDHKIDEKGVRRIHG